MARFHADRAQREQVEAELEREAGLEPGDVTISCPAPGMALKEADILVDAGRGSPVQPLAAYLVALDAFRRGAAPGASPR